MSCSKVFLSIFNNRAIARMELPCLYNSCITIKIPSEIIANTSKILSAIVLYINRLGGPFLHEVFLSLSFYMVHFNTGRNRFH